MALKSDPEMGINSWLEDELYQQYLNDRSAVDESWKHVFEEPTARAGRARRAAGRRPGAPPTASSPCAAPPARSPRT